MANASRVGIYCEKHASAAYPSNPRMSSTHSTTHPGIFHDIPQLRTFDNKCVQAIMKVQTWIFYTMHAYYRILTTDAAREGRGCLQTMPNCEEEEPPLGGSAN